jgi:hypothetical protein
MKAQSISKRLFLLWVAFWLLFLFIGFACSESLAIEVTPTAGIPDFPWPPPKPSAFANLTFGSLRESLGGEVTFGDVNARISEALHDGKYGDHSYYGIPGGFAIATRLEQINEDGSPNYSNRWSAEITPTGTKKFSLHDYLVALFTAPKGRYRVFVFMVTSNEVTPSGTPVSQGTAKTWVVEGANKLPTNMKSILYTEDNSCTVYVYEFIQSGYSEQANQNIPSILTGEEHLQEAGLWDTLEK